MSLRRTATVAFLTAALALGGATAASAHSVPPPQAACHRAEHRLAAAHRLEQRLDAKEVRLERALARAEDAGRNRLAAQLRAVIARNDRHQARVDTVIARVEAAIATHCETPGS